MSLYRKKPAIIEAREVTYEELDTIARWCGGDITMPSGIDIPTLEGTMHAQMHDWIIRGVQSEFYPCKPDIFAETYEPSEARRPLQGIKLTDGDTRERCRAALSIRGAAYRCDLAAEHAGWSHSSKAAESIWADHQ